MKSYKHLYSLSFKGKKDCLHFAAHSHHPWPDCTFDAHKQYWLDSATQLDGKWNYIFSDVIPKTQKNIASLLNISNPEMIAIAPNTHEFVVRLFSCFGLEKWNSSKKIKVLTTDSEFHSFRRQLQRYIEEGAVEAEIIPVEPYETFEKRWADQVTKKFDMIFTSQVFFNSGLMCPNFEKWIPLSHKDSMIVIDGYHGFSAIPQNFKKYEDRAFYLAGGYKYAQAGEGVCFMSIPKSNTYRPVNTGWFASFETLNQPMSEKIQYSESGMKFSGSTFDPSGCYRLNSVMDLLRKENLTIESIHERILEIKKYFISSLEKAQITELKTQNIIQQLGQLTESHFVTFKIQNANEIQEILEKNNIIVDSRGDRLRFGFGLYHDLKDIDVLVKKLSQVFGKNNFSQGFSQSAKGEATL